MTCDVCGLPDPYRGQGDGIGSCDCPRCDCGSARGSMFCDCEPDDDPDAGWDDDGVCECCECQWARHVETVEPLEAYL